MPWSSVDAHLATLLPNKEDPLVCAVSGGVDSQVLLHLLGSRGYSAVHVVSFDHGWREDTAADRGVVEALAGQYGFAVQWIVLDPTTCATENAARQERYHHLERERVRIGAAWILTGHHADDLLESQLLHLERGSGLFGMVGIRLCDPARHLLRPLLPVTKQAIRSYAERCQVPWHEDLSNRETRFARNRLRARGTGDLEPYIPDVYAWSRRLSEEAQEDLASLAAQASRHLGPTVAEGYVMRKSWNTLPRPAQEMVLLAWLRDAGAAYTHAHVDSLLRRLGSMRTGGRVFLGADRWIRRDYDRLSLSWSLALPALPAEVPVPADAPADLHKVALQPHMPLLRYRRTELGWAPWHTSLKKWRVSTGVAREEAAGLSALVTTEEEVVAIVHPKWQYPHDFPTRLHPVPRG